MPLYVLYQLECDQCGAIIQVKAPIDLMLRKPQKPTLEPVVTPDPDRIYLCGERPVDPYPSHWDIRAGYPDRIHCPACHPQPPKPPEAR